MSSAERSTDTPSANVSGFPTELQDENCWLCWTGKDDGKTQAIDPQTGDVVDSPDQGISLEAAKQGVDNPQTEGIALVIRPDDDYIGIRLHDCVQEAGDELIVEDWAEESIEHTNSYTELDPSGEDVVILTKGQLPDDEYESDKIGLISSGVIPLAGRPLSGFAEIEPRQKELESLFEEYNQYEPPESKADNEDTLEIDEDVTLADVRETVVKNFDEAQWHLTEAILSTHATLFIDEIQNCTGLIVVGRSGAGKTTALRFFEGLTEQFYRSDEVTPASFVTHDASLSEEELEEVDLLPRITHKSLVCRDMETWFSGDKETIRTTMSRMTHLMDGEGLTRDSGSHGKRGYEGDYRFSFIGASTPLKSRAWDVMGNAGYRFVFYHKEPRPDDQETLENNLFGETSYGDEVAECKQKVKSFLHCLWNEYGGYGSIPDNDIDFSDDAKKAIPYLAKVVKFSRATISEQSGEEDLGVKREDAHRIGAVLREIAKGRALINGETTVEVDDVVVSGRVALSTMPSKRRPLVRTLLNPANDGQLTRNEAQDTLGVSKPTALERMELMKNLEIAEFVEVENDDRGTKKLELKEEFEWPDVLPFPDR